MIKIKNKTVPNSLKKNNSKNLNQANKQSLQKAVLFQPLNLNILLLRIIFQLNPPLTIPPTQNLPSLQPRAGTPSLLQSKRHSGRPLPHQNPAHLSSLPRDHPLQLLQNAEDCLSFQI